MPQDSVAYKFNGDSSSIKLGAKGRKENRRWFCRWPKFDYPLTQKHYLQKTCRISTITFANTTNIMRNPSNSLSFPKKLRGHEVPSKLRKVIIFGVRNVVRKSSGDSDVEGFARAMDFPSLQGKMAQIQKKRKDLYDPPPNRFHPF